jgi:hypothetical protein
MEAVKMLDIKWFEEYEKEFSESKDKSAFFDKYYDPEAEFIHPFKGIFKGKQALVNFLECRQKLRPCRNPRGD